MTFWSFLFLTTPLAISGLGLLARSKPVRWFLIVLGLLFFVGLCWHAWTVGDGNPLNAPTLLILALYIYVAPIFVVIALLFELIKRMGWKG